jgi:hypothetical protein
MIITVLLEKLQFGVHPTSVSKIGNLKLETDFYLLEVSDSPPSEGLGEASHFFLSVI